MPRIHLLDKSVYELIAAGEVVERPASAVKELLENSIDAGATIVVIEVKNGGKTYLRVTDNGCGMSPEDVPLAFMRHATSKINSKDDLDAINTLGFRGEALASICAVSKVQLLTKRKEDDLGYLYEIDGGEEVKSESCGCPNGTTIIVRDLFYNVPARQKFLKKDAYEYGTLATMVQKIALSHPEVAFKLIRDNKVEFFTAGNGDILSCIYSVLGKAVYDACIPVSYEYRRITVSGYVVKPLASKASRTFQNFFINSRYIRSGTISSALEEAYKDRIMTGKFPACVLHITMPSDMIDVNAHPAKLDVRFRETSDLYSAVYFGVYNALENDDSPEEIRAEGGRISANSDMTHIQLYQNVTVADTKPEQLVFATTSGARETEDNSSKEDYTEAPRPQMYTYTHTKPYEEKPEISYRKDSSTEPNLERNFKYINENSFRAEKTVTEQPKPLEIKVIGEAFKTYIIAQCGDDILLVDKHAAHERLIYEQLKKARTSLDSQLLLNPVETAVSYEQYNALSENEDVLKRLGFSIKFVDAPNISICGSPMIASDTDPIDTVLQVADSIIDGKRSRGEDIFDDLYHTFACKAAIKANSDTSKVEMERLMELITEEDIRYCPHGRPILVKLTKYEIEKMFRRIV